MLLRNIFTISFLILLFYSFSQKSLAQSGVSCVATISPTGEVSYCPGGYITLTANSGNKLSYQWYRNDVLIENATQVTYQADVAGIYKVKVSSTATPAACTFAFSPEVNVSQGNLPAVPNFSISPATAQCSGTPINLAVSQPMTGLTYTWDFGDGSTATGSAVTHTFYSQDLTGQDFNVRLTATNGIGCTSTSQPQIVTVRPGPVINLTNNNNFRNCGGNTFNLLVFDQSEIAPEQIVSYKINWGDGSALYTSNTAPAGINHPYPVGAYILTYTLETTDGCSVTKEYSVYNISNPGITVRGTGNTIGCGPLTINFPLEGFASNHPSTTYTVDFGDGTAKKIFTHQQLLANPIISHIYEKTSCGNPGGSGFAADAFRFLIEATNSCGSTPFAVGGIRVYSKSKANFTMKTEKACVGLVTEFINTTQAGMNADCNHNTNYYWNFGDGSSEIATPNLSTIPKHTYAAPGFYTVTLRAENNCEPDIFSKEIEVIHPPVARFSTTADPNTACIDATISTNNLSTGGLVSYRWQIKPNTGYTLANGSSLTSANPVFQFETPGIYRIMLTAFNACKEDTTSQRIVIKGRPTVSLPAGKTYCGPQTLTFDPEPGNHTVLYEENFGIISAYNWTVNGPGSITFESGTTASSPYPVMGFTEAGIYTIVTTVSNECGDSESASQTVTINPIPVVSEIPPVTICYNTRATFMLPEINGVYKWYSSPDATTPLNNDTNDATGRNFITDVLTSNQTYYVEITSPENCTSARIPAQVIVTPVITNNTIEGAQTLCLGAVPASITGSVPNGGGGTNFVWETSLDNVNYTTDADITTQDYTFNTPLTQTTWFRRTVVSASCPAVTTPAVLIEIQKPITLNTISAAQVICDGEKPVKLTGSTPEGGKEPYRYQWQYSTDNENFTDITLNGTAQDYEPVALKNTTWFRRKVSGGVCAADISTAIQITVNPLPQIPTSSNLTICANNTVELTASAPSGVIQWFTSATGGTAVGTGNTYTTPVLTQTTTYYIQVVENNCPSARKAVTVTVKPAPIATATPASLEICNNGTPNIRLTANLAGTTFAWQPINTVIQGATAGTGAVIAQPLTNNSNVPASVTYLVTPTLNGCAGPTIEVTITVNPNLDNNSISAAQTICHGSQPAKLIGSVPNGGSTRYEYRWEISLTGNSDSFGAAPGGTEADYQPGTLTDNTWFRRTISSGGCFSTSEIIKISVLPAITNYNVSANQVICAGSVPAPIVGGLPTGGIGTFSYIWEISLNATDFNTIIGATDKDYAPGAVFDPTWFRRITISGNCQEISPAMQVIIQQPITGNSILAEQVICAGQAPNPLSGSSPANGNGDYKYQWQSSPDGSNFQDILVSSSDINRNGKGKDFQPPVLNTPAPIWYQRLVTAGVCATSVSNVIRIIVNPAIENNVITSSPETICEGSEPNLITAGALKGGNNNYEYRWESSLNPATTIFAPAAGTNTNPDYAAGVLTETTWFRRVVISGGCEVISEPIKITVNKPITNNAILTENPIIICSGNAAPLISATTPSNGNGTYTYIWQKRTDLATEFVDIITNGNQKDYNPGILTQTTWFRRVVISAPCGRSESLPVKVQVNEVISNNKLLTGAQTICAGSQSGVITGTIPMGGSGTYNYIWESSTTSATAGFSTITSAPDHENYLPGPLNRTTWFRRKVVSDPCSALLSENVIEITVTPTVINRLVTTNRATCSGTASGLLEAESPSGGTGTFTIVWESHTEGSVFGPAEGNNSSSNYNVGILTQDTWFRRKVSSGACVDLSEEIKITVYPVISNNILDGDQDLCARSTPDIIIGSNPTGGNSQYLYLWESSTDNKTFTAAAGKNNARDYQSGEILVNTWFRRRVSAGNCEPVVSDAVRITVSPGVTNNTIGVAQRICIGTTAAPLVGSTPVTGNNELTYVWEVSTFNSSAGFETAPGINNTKDYQPRDLTRTSWFRRTIISGGCNSTSRVVQITVDKNIDNNIISSAQTICTQTAPATLIGSTHTGGNESYTYEWEMSSDGIRYVAAPGVNTEKNYTPPVLTKSTWYRRVIYATPCGASESEPIRITVLAVITENSIQQDQEICSGTAPGTIRGSLPKGGSGTYTYLWEMSTDNKMGSFSPAPGKNNEADYSPAELTATTFFRRIVYAAPCQQTISNSVKILVNPLPSVPTVADVVTCVGESATLTASGIATTFTWYSEATGGAPVHVGKTFVTPVIMGKTIFYAESQSATCASARVPVMVTTHSTVADAGPDVTIIKGTTVLLKASGGTQYTWSPAEGLSNANIVNPVASPQVTTTYRVTVQTPEGCTSSDDVTVTVIPKIIPTNGITPNGDGANDTWVIKNIEYYPEAEIEIFNRWGNKIFSSKGYKTPWDGTLNGQPLPVAAYYYIIKLTKDEAPISGNITLIR